MVVHSNQKRIRDIERLLRKKQVLNANAPVVEETEGLTRGQHRENILRIQKEEELIRLKAAREVDDR